MEAKIDIFLCKVFYSLICNKLWRPVTLLYFFMGYLMDEGTFMSHSMMYTLNICFKLFMLSTFRITLEGGWVPSIDGDVFLKGVMSMDISFVVVDLVL